MRKFNLATVSLLFLILLNALSCSEPKQDVLEEESAPRLTVFVNIPPQAYLVERIGGVNVEVEVLVPPGQDPHTFSPSPRTMKTLAEADIYFYGRMEFGRLLARRIKESGTAGKIIDLSEGVDLRAMEEPCAHDHNHDCEHNHDHNHDHAGKDPHIWLGPPEIKVMAENIARTLREVDGENQHQYRSNLKDFLAELEKTDAELRKTLQSLRGKTFYVYHPAFGYFASAYDLRQKAVETGGGSPTPKQLRQLISQAQDENVQVIFVQPQFASRSAEAVAEAINGAIVLLDPLEYDILANLQRISEQVKKALLANDQ